jgi:flavin reductase (DIM6/NTAB) family NADH-FMN oxidoreductase RutF
MKKNAALKGALQPTPKIIVTVRDRAGRDNALVVAYCGNCSFAPPMLMVGVVPSRFSHHMIKENGAFVAHLVTRDQTALYECCGKRSGSDGDKLKAIGAKLENGEKVNAAILTECPVAIECTVVDSIMTGSHEMFIGKVECVHAEEELIQPDGTIDFSKLNLM